uniref:bifunctional 2-C-methyl-D-erythritol 4-phosphate cytidylyltransferase/2-C-methyl-D-erythritol 2,4-cyclodiphosphate synthase n=1 Tax=Parerythrobacter lutipelagi TaxID=1964208 RepID=UPI0010F69ACD|nr:bifunctional 2-C-methyl-D-erythritol 4-phosphate cytidylyltransferase/2-C-methyl-D-erythritol 2,4-cyclodiphosphate synthase [Parerythrobacter lutipelagi]
MSDDPSQTQFSAVIVAGGQGLRAGQSVPKQFANWRGKPVLSHSLKSLADAGADPIIVVVPSPQDQAAQQIIAEFACATLAKGGLTRQQSVLAGLLALQASAPERVLIHDAARPDLPRSVIDRLLHALDSHIGAIPVLPVVDSLAFDTGGMMAGAANREELRRVQTPQAFRYAEILAAHRAWDKESGAGDDAQVARAAQYEVALVAGDEALKKLTFAEDFTVTHVPVRIGTGFDVHRLGPDEELWLCGIKLDHEKGLIGHSDADVGLHAITDAILGAVAAGDIGQHFSPTDARWKGAASDRFLAHARDLAAERGYAVGNVDVTLVCEEPKIGPHRGSMAARIAEILEIDSSQVSVKATTTEKLGFAGRGEGIAAQAVATMIAEDKG